MPALPSSIGYTVYDSDANFHVGMPGKPVKTTSQSDVGGVRVATVSYQWSSRDSRTVYVVAYEQFPQQSQAILSSSPSTVFHEIITTMVSAEPNATAPAPVDSMFQGNPAETATVTGASGTLSVMVFTANTYVFELSVVSPNPSAASGVSMMSNSFAFGSS